MNTAYTAITSITWYQMRNPIRLKLLFLACACLGTLQPVLAESFVSENDRPDRQWIDAFNGAKRVIVETSIEQALTQCPTQQYCELIIDQLVLTKTVDINRSKTRIRGVKGNRVRMSDEGRVSGFFFRIGQGVNQVIFSDLNIDGENIERHPDVFGIGAYNSEISHIQVSNNRIANFHGNENAHAIAFYGVGATQASAINNIIIENNTIADMRTGSSESIVINGNVRRWEIVGNDIQRINNIAIDAIGGEGTAPVQTLADGRIAPGKFDAARLGFIENNTVTDMSTKNNPAYGNKASWAAAIYIDGGHSIKVSGNSVTSVPWGLEIGAENCTTSSFIQMFNNESSNAQFGDILIGGYSKGGYVENPSINCDPKTSHDDSEGHGSVSNIDVRNNRMKSKNTGGGSFIGNTVLQYRIHRSTVEQPYIRISE